MEDIEKQEQIESAAKAQGWKPKEEFGGPEENWRTAEEFLKVGEENIPVTRERNKYLSEEVNKLKSALDKQGQTLHSLAAHHKRTFELSYKKALRDLESQRKEAVELGDSDKFDSVEREITELKATVAEPTPQETTNNKDIVDSWMVENTWFKDDLTLHRAAVDASNLIAYSNPDFTPKQQLDAVKEMVMKAYPDKFNKKEKVSAVIGGDFGASGGSKGNKKSYSDLPADAKKACDDFVKQGIMTKDDYIKDYFTQEI